MRSNLTYASTAIDPVNDQDGGEPGGNIRVAYLYNPVVLQLRNPNPGSSTDANEVLPGPELKYNPGRIDPLNAAWTASRKPLAATWETVDGKNKFFTVNVHFGSKGGGSPIEGDARPPVNGGVYDRLAQTNATAVSSNHHLSLPTKSHMAWHLVLHRLHSGRRQQRADHYQWRFQRIYLCRPPRDF